MTSTETFICLYSKHSPSCQRVWNEIQYITQHMPSMLYDIDDPNTRRIIQRHGLIQTVPFIILLNQSNGNVTMYQNTDALNCIGKAVQLINTQISKTRQQTNTTSLDSLGLKDDPLVAANARTTPSDILMSDEHLNMASTSTRPSGSEQVSSFPGAQMLENVLDSASESQVMGKDDGMSMRDILGEQDHMSGSKETRKKSDALKTSAESILAERDREEQMITERRKQAVAGMR
jgi:hypothetical protein